MTARRIFGLSVDEQFAWAVIDVDSAEECITSTYRDGLLKDILSRRTGKPVTLQFHLYNELVALKEREPKLFEDVSAVGISCIGIVQRDQNKLINIRRKEWVGKGGFLVNFVESVAALFGPKVRVVSQNDATAKALAEFHWSYRFYREGAATARPPVETLCYALFSEGVNAGIVHGRNGRGSPVVKSYHHELGHIHPPLYKTDKEDAENGAEWFNGCPAHRVCFEGVASDFRVRTQWRNRLDPRKTDRSAISQLIDQKWNGGENDAAEALSHYIAHFCWNVVLMATPQRIVIGGSLEDERLLDQIRDKFDELNRGRSDKAYYDISELADPLFFRLSQLPWRKAGVLGALELARLSVFDDL